MTDVQSPPAARLARGLAARLRDAADAADRLADFAFEAGAEAPPPTLADGEEATAAHDFLLRTLGLAADPVNHAILTTACRAEAGVPIERLSADLHLSELSVIERAHGLIQVGLVARDLQAGTVLATTAGQALVELIAELERDVAEWLGKRQRRR
jgi:predicted DNA-binding transcriptional regulator